MPGDDGFDPVRILTVLEAHGVEYLLVGGFAAQAHGALRQTRDLDLVPSTTAENYERLAAALRELNARLRVGGMTDEEARQLPVVIDATTLRSFGSSTWTTDAGPLDILAELRDPAGGHHPYGDLAGRHVANDIEGVVVGLAALEDIIASKEYAGREKDLEALPELRLLRDRQPSPGNLE